jgi:hypothetical protein
MFGGPRVVCSTIQTQASGGDGGGRMTRFDPRLFGVVVVDEGHHSTSASYRRVLDWYTTNPDLRVLGVTATPDRADEEALGQVYETVALDYEIQDAIGDGWLVPVTQQMVHVEGLDFSACRTTAGDLNGADLAKVMEYEENLHRVVAPAIEIIGSRRALVFASSVDHAERMCELFNRHRPGAAAWVCGKTDRDDRRKTLADFSSGRVQIVCNCGVLTEGFDNPGVEVVIMARPTKSRALYAQMAGRATRPADAIAHCLNDHDSPEARRALIEASVKPTCLIVDFVGNSGRHKLMTSVDILGGRCTEDVRALAIKKCGAGKPMRVDVALSAAEEERKAEELKAQAREAARRAALTARAKWNAENVNPFDVFEVQPVADRGWDRGKRLSEGQANVLRKQGIDPDALPYGQARQLLNELFRRWDGNLCSFAQAKILRKRGMHRSSVRQDLVPGGGVAGPGRQREGRGVRLGGADLQRGRPWYRGHPDDCGGASYCLRPGAVARGVPDKDRGNTDLVLVGRQPRQHPRLWVSGGGDRRGGRDPGQRLALRAASDHRTDPGLGGIRQHAEGAQLVL